MSKSLPSGNLTAESSYFNSSVQVTHTIMSFANSIKDELFFFSFLLTPQVQSMTTSTSASTRYRSRTPGPGEESRRGTGAGLGSSSDCIYSLGESVNGLELYRCPSPPLNTTTTGANSGFRGGGGGACPAVWTAGLKRYGGTDFDAYCLQQGLSRSESLSLTCRCVFLIF